MSYNGDVVAYYDELDRLQAEYERSLPVCDYCGRLIQDEKYYEINGDKICQECLDDNFLKWTEDFCE